MTLIIPYNSYDKIFEFTLPYNVQYLVDPDIDVVVVSKYIECRRHALELFAEYPAIKCSVIKPGALSIDESKRSLTLNTNEIYHSNVPAFVNDSKKRTIEISKQGYITGNLEEIILNEELNCNGEPNDCVTFKLI